MKTILIPTDFSQAALRAVEFGVMFAKKTDARLVLFHAYGILVPPEQSVSPMYTANLYDAAEKSSHQQMESLKASLFRQHPWLKKEHRLETQLICGFPVDSILDKARNTDPDYILMGTKGASNRFDAFLGTVASSVVQHSPCPVLVIPPKTQVGEIRSVLYASNLRPGEAFYIREVSELAANFKAEAKVLHITTPRHNEAQVKEMKTHLERKLENHPVVFRTLKRPDVGEGLETYIKNQRPDLVAVTMHEKGFLQRLIERNLVRHLTLTTQVPLLVFPDSKETEWPANRPLSKTMAV